VKTITSFTEVNIIDRPHQRGPQLAQKNWRKPQRRRRRFYWFAADAARDRILARRGEKTTSSKANTSKPREVTSQRARADYRGELRVERRWRYNAAVLPYWRFTVAVTRWSRSTQCFSALSSFSSWMVDGLWAG